MLLVTVQGPLACVQVLSYRPDRRMPANKGLSYRSKSGTGRSTHIKAARMIESKRMAKAEIPSVPRKRDKPVPKPKDEPIPEEADLEAVKVEMLEGIKKVDLLEERVRVLGKRWKRALRWGNSFLDRWKRDLALCRHRPKRWHRERLARCEVFEKIEERAAVLLENAEVDLDVAEERGQKLCALGERFIAHNTAMIAALKGRHEREKNALLSESCAGPSLS